MLISTTGEIQLFSSKDMEPITIPIQVGIHDIACIEVTDDG